jgi:hypothetical protein
VEAIAGHELAATVAKEIGVGGWTTEHNSDAFKLTTRQIYVGLSNYLKFWSHGVIGVPVATGVDELALALTAEAYSRTWRSSALTVAATNENVRTRRGLTVIPDRVVGGRNLPSRILPSVEQGLPVTALDQALDGIATAYGTRTAAFVALQLEYPQ